MKYFTLILAIYFLALNGVPCSDTGNINEDSQVVSLIDYDGEHDQDCELCSPFCHCHCCHVHTIDFGITSFEPYQPKISQEYFDHFDGFENNFFHSLLQPPQV
ncbi:DUF6660 family protein [Aquimarina algicola]|uniref:Uncharacterized protein n=1 Tax=Aquimarina algicola TaxID=2589995 RepID=A0A504JFT4_9FLAO|nr:DUF6660 family protein [Aquimarina algicola]TPN87305.1 hypothetical protein FHK87_06885 [Aquimarina algicola]